MVIYPLKMVIYPLKMWIYPLKMVMFHSYVAVYQREPLVIIHVRLRFSINHPMLAWGYPHLWKPPCMDIYGAWMSYVLVFMALQLVSDGLGKGPTTNLRWIFVSSTCSKKNSICAISELRLIVFSSFGWAANLSPTHLASLFPAMVR